MKKEFTLKQILGLIIAGIKNGHYQAVINLAQGWIDELEKQSKEDSPDNSKGTKEK